MFHFSEAKALLRQMAENLHRMANIPAFFFL
jgi:hypothetical protein